LWGGTERIETFVTNKENFQFRTKTRRKKKRNTKNFSKKQEREGEQGKADGAPKSPTVGQGEGVRRCPLGEAAKRRRADYGNVVAGGAHRGGIWEKVESDSEKRRPGRVRGVGGKKNSGLKASGKEEREPGKERCKKASQPDGKKALEKARFWGEGSKKKKKI